MTTPTTLGRYTYYLAYSHSRGFGASVYTLPEPMDTFEKVTAAAAEISRNNPHLGGVLILNFQLMTYTPAT